MGIGREMLNFYRGVAKKYGDNWPKFNMMMHGVHALLDQEYSGDINIVPKFRFQNPLNLITQPNEQELRQLVKEGERHLQPDRADQAVHANLQNSGGDPASL